MEVVPCFGMTETMSTLAVVVVLLLVCRYSSAQPGSCTPNPPILSGVNIGAFVHSNNVPRIRTDQAPTLFRGSVGGFGAGRWTVFSESQVRNHGLWCQVQQAATGGVANNNIGDWYYPTPSGLLALDNMVNDGTPYQELKCDNQVGLVVDGDIVNNQGIVRCTTTITGLSPVDVYMAVYKDNVYEQLRSRKLTWVFL